MAVCLGIYIGVRGTLGIGATAGIAVWLVGWPLFAVAMRRRWWQRSNTEYYPDFASVIRRPLRRASDRLLSWLIWSFAFFALVSVAGIFSGDILGSLFTLAMSALIVATARAERRRRMSEQQAGGGV
jgi:hypothetical protein